MTYQNALVALSDPTRRRVFEQLRRGPMSVGKIAAEMPVSRPAVSQHLGVLKGRGSWQTEPRGRAAFSTSTRMDLLRSERGSTNFGTVRCRHLKRSWKRRGNDQNRTGA